MPTQDYQSYQVQVGSNLDGAGVGFNAQTLIVNNPTPYWWFLPSQQIWIQPYALNAVYALNGTQKFSVQFAAPPGYNQPIPTGALATAYATFELYGAALTPAPAYSAIYGSDARLNVSPSFTLIGAGDTTTYLFPTALPGGFCVYIPAPTLFVPTGYVRGDVTTTNGQTFSSEIAAYIDMLSAATIPNGAYLDCPRSFPAGTSLTLIWGPGGFPAPGGRLTGVIQY